MCHKIRCSRCGKPSWAGCGAHVEHALAGIPREERCGCREEEPKTVVRTEESAQRSPKPRKLFGIF
jgi:hypothetical protein